MLELNQGQIPADLMKYFRPKKKHGSWICRNDIIWHKRNCMPASVTDRFTVDYERIFMFTKQGKYWFEQQFERGFATSAGSAQRDTQETHGLGGGNSGINAAKEKMKKELAENGFVNRNMRCVWDITTKGYKEAHFATFPEKLIEPMIKAGCPKEICVKCGKAREKIYRPKFTDHTGTTESEYDTKKSTAGRLALLRQAARERGEEYTGEKELVGYTDCGCNAGFTPGVVADIFMGSGTTAVVAKNLGRQWVCIELNEKYIEMANRRIENTVVNGTLNL